MAAEAWAGKAQLEAITGANGARSGDAVDPWVAVIPYSNSIMAEMHSVDQLPTISPPGSPGRTKRPRSLSPPLVKSSLKSYRAALKQVLTLPVSYIDKNPKRVLAAAAITSSASADLFSTGDSLFGSVPIERPRSALLNPGFLADLSPVNNNLHPTASHLPHTISIPLPLNPTPHGRLVAPPPNTRIPNLVNSLVTHYNSPVRHDAQYLQLFSRMNRIGPPGPLNTHNGKTEGYRFVGNTRLIAYEGVEFNRRYFNARLAVDPLNLNHIHNLNKDAPPKEDEVPKVDGEPSASATPSVAGGSGGGGGFKLSLKLTRSDSSAVQENGTFFGGIVGGVASGSGATSGLTNGDVVPAQSTSEMIMDEEEDLPTLEELSRSTAGPTTSAIITTTPDGMQVDPEPTIEPANRSSAPPTSRPNLLSASSNRITFTSSSLPPPSPRAPSAPPAEITTDPIVAPPPVAELPTIVLNSATTTPVPQAALLPPVPQTADLPSAPTEILPLFNPVESLPAESIDAPVLSTALPTAESIAPPLVMETVAQPVQGGEQVVPSLEVKEEQLEETLGAEPQEAEEEGDASLWGDDDT